MSVFDKISGIPVASGFKLQAKLPLDPRLVVESIDDRDSLITENGAYEGMQVYVKADKKTYCLKGLTATAGTWEEVGGAEIVPVQETGSSTTDVMSQNAVTVELNKKQETLVSGTNIKTVNSQSILGTGDLEISGGGTTYSHLISFDYYNKSDRTKGGSVSLVVSTNSKDTIVNTNETALKVFVGKFANGGAYPISCKTNGQADQAYTGIYLNTSDDTLRLTGNTVSEKESGEIVISNLKEIIVNPIRIQYYAPTISLSGVNDNILTITPDVGNKDIKKYTVFVGIGEMTKLADLTPDAPDSVVAVNLYEYSQLAEIGSYTLTVVAVGDSYEQSPASNSVIYTVSLFQLDQPQISLVSNTTIQIDTIDDRATTIEIFVDGTSIGEVEKETSTGYTLTVGSISKTDNPDGTAGNDFGTLTLFKNGSSTGEVVDLINLQNSDILAQGVTSVKFTYVALSGKYGSSSCIISSTKLLSGSTKLTFGEVYQVTENIDDINLTIVSKADAPA